MTPTTPATPYLIVAEPNGRVHTFTLPADLESATIGRHEDSHVALPWDPNVSRSHAELQRLGPEWVVIDDGLSRNGTTVNGQPLTGRRRLRDGDVIQVGFTQLTYCDGQDRGDSTVTPSDRHPPPALTDKQHQVLLALCRPCLDPRTIAPPASNEQIAAELHISVPAVKAHLRDLFAKFGIGDLPHNTKRTQLVAEAISRRAVTR